MKIDQGTLLAPPAPPGSTIPSREPFDFADLMQQIRDTVDEVKGKMDGVFASISTTSENANDLIKSVRGDVENIISTSKKVSRRCTGDHCRSQSRTRHRGQAIQRREGCRQCE